MCTFVFDRNVGISGAVTAIAPSPSIMMSTSLDRCARAHSVIPPLNSRDRKGEILQKFYLTGVPTAAVWDHTLSGGATAANDESVKEQDDVWDKMVHVGDDDPLTTRSTKTM
jgi:ribosome biogenesis protein NSA1